MNIQGSLVFWTRRWLALGLLATASVGLSGLGCAHRAATAPSRAPEPVLTAVSSAYAVLRDARGAEIGVVRLERAAEGLQIRVEAQGLAPNREIAFHVHEVGMCEWPEFKSAGGHFNPMRRQHGHKNPNGAHSGDLPNLKVNAQGRVRFETLTQALSLDPARQDSLIRAQGTSVILHAERDDGSTDPSGNAGARIACGVVVAGARP